MDTVPDWLLDNPVGATIGPDAVRARLLEGTGWEGRARALLALGDALPPLPASERSEANQLHGCQASVWVVHAFDVGTRTLYVNCDSDARVVKGLLACILSGYNGQTLEGVQAFDAVSFLQSLQLDAHLASERRNGLLAMIGKVRMLAHRYAT